MQDKSKRRGKGARKGKTGKWKVKVPRTVEQLRSKLWRLNHGHAAGISVVQDYSWETKMQQIC